MFAVAGAAGCVELAELGVARLAELAGFAVVGAAGCVEQAEFAGTGVVRFAGLAELAKTAKCAELAMLGIAQQVPVQRRRRCINTG